MLQARINECLPQVDLLGTGLLSNCLRRSGVSEQRERPHPGKRRAAILPKSPYKWEMGFQHTEIGVATRQLSR